MIIDKYDIKIIKILYNLKDNEEINTKYDMVKKVFEGSEEYEMRKNYTRIKRKLAKLEKYGIIKIIKNQNKITYQLQTAKIEFKKIKFICIKIKGEWVSFPFDANTMLSL